MKRSLLAISFLFFLMLSMSFPLIAFAAETVPYFTYSLDKQSAVSGDIIKLKINANHKNDTAAGFRMVINYDASVVSFVRTETSSQIKSGTMVTNSQINPIISVYVCNTDKAAAPELSGNIISFVFKVNDDIQEGKTQIGAHIDEVCNYQSQQLNLNFDENLALKVEPQGQPSNKAYLTALTPFTGTLMPPFSQDVLNYNMDVEYDVTSVEFAATAGERGTVKINRKTLQRAGTDTIIIATVTSADKKATSQYVITVSRAAKPLSTSSKSSNGTATGGKASSRTNTGGANQTTGKSSFQNDSSEEKETSSTIPQAVLPSGTAQQSPAYTDHGDRNIYIIGNQMPTYVVGMLTAGLCIMIGIALAFWLKIKPKK